jgi:hypothetical protein
LHRLVLNIAIAKSGGTFHERCHTSGLIRAEGYD